MISLMRGYVLNNIESVVMANEIARRCGRVILTDDKWHAPGSTCENELTLDDFFMTVEQFFNAGHEFQEDDCILDVDGVVYVVTVDDWVVDRIEPELANRRTPGDDKRYVTHARVLKNLVIYI